MEYQDTLISVPDSFIKRYQFEELAQNLRKRNNTMQAITDEDRLKQLLKEALIEAVQEQKGLFYDLIFEIIEDIAMANAIREGVNTEKVGRGKNIRHTGRAVVKKENQTKQRFQQI